MPFLLKLVSILKIKPNNRGKFLVSIYKNKSDI